MKNTVFIGLGSNLGDKIKNIDTAINELAKEKFITINNKSNYYLTEPIDMESDKKFINTVLEIDTSLDPFEVLSITQKIEEKLGRKEKGNNKPRIIDLDILCYNDYTIKSKNLVIPHSEMTKRLFVLIPLKEIAPNWKDKAQNKNIDELITGLQSKQGIRLIEQGQEDY